MESPHILYAEHYAEMARMRVAHEAAVAIEKATGKTAMERACEAMARPARLALIQTIKSHARHYAKRPGDMISLHRDLPGAGSRMALAIADHLEEFGRRHDSGRWGEYVPLSNARAVRLYGRWLRRLEWREAAKIAA